MGLQKGAFLPTTLRKKLPLPMTLHGSPVLLHKIQIILMHAVDHDSAMNRKEARTPATTWMNLKNIMLCERSQTQKTT